MEVSILKNAFKATLNTVKYRTGSIRFVDREILDSFVPRGNTLDRKFFVQDFMAAKKAGVGRVSFSANPGLVRRIVNVLPFLRKAGLDLKNLWLFVDKEIHEHLVKASGTRSKSFFVDLRSPEEGHRVVVSWAPKLTLRQAIGEKILGLLKKLGLNVDSTRHPYHRTVFALMKGLHMQNLQQAGFESAYMTQKLPKDFWKLVSKHVSLSAVVGKNPQNVLAEMATARLFGKDLKLPPVLAQFLRDNWHGPELPFGLLKDVK